MSDITTARLHMRRFTEADGKSLASLHGDAEVMTYMRGGAETRSQTDAELAGYRECWALHGFGMWALILEGIFIGECGLRQPTGEAKGIRLRVVIHKPYWGRGLAGEAIAAALGYGFDAAALTLVRAVTQESNPASQRVLERAGMTVEEFFLSDKGSRMRLYAITSDAWTDLQAGN